MRSRMHLPVRRKASQHGRHRPAVLLSLLTGVLGLLAVGAAGFAAALTATTPAFATPATAAAPAGTADLASSQHALALVRAAIVQAAYARAAKAAPGLLTVRSGQTLSSIAQSVCGNPADWTGIYARSRQLHLTAWNANNLVVGQHLAVQCYQNPGMAGRAYTPPPPPVVQAAYQAPAQQASYQAPAAGSGGGGNVNPGSYSGYQACVVERESGGDSQVMNSSGHYGLYQFDYGTWVSGGGAAGDFGHASVAEQNQVFAVVYAARGTQPWSPSDGC